MKKMKLILNESLISNKDSDIIEDTSVQAQPDYQIIDVTVIPDEDYYPTVQAILIDLDEDGALLESDGNKLDINILSETVNQKTNYSNSLFEFESANHTITLSLVLQETDRRGIYKVEAYTTRGVKVFESNTYKPKYVIESYLNSLANEYLIDKPLKESTLSHKLSETEYMLITYRKDGDLDGTKETFSNCDLKEMKDIIYNYLISGDADRVEFYKGEDYRNFIGEYTLDKLSKLDEAEEEPIETPVEEVEEDEENYSLSEFADAEKLKDEVLNLDIDYSEWNESTPEEREELVRPAITEFVNKHREEFDEDQKVLEILEYELTDKNFHTEVKVMEEVYRGGKGNE